MQDLFLYIVVGCGVIIFLWMFILSFLYYRQQQFFKEMTKDISKKDLGSILKSLAVAIKNNADNAAELRRHVQIIEKMDKRHLQKIGFIRYNPFSDTGGDQSFCLCLLDDLNNGIILTSLHSREQTRIYGKPVKQGKPFSYELSKEENEVLQMALKPTKLPSPEESKK